METENKIFEAFDLQKAHSYDQEEVGNCLQIVLGSNVIKTVIEALQNYKAENSEKKHCVKRCLKIIRLYSMK